MFIAVATFCKKDIKSDYFYAISKKHNRTSNINKINILFNFDLCLYITVILYTLFKNTFLLYYNAKSIIFLLIKISYNYYICYLFLQIDCNIQK
jgi:hypothetical protein